MSDEARPIISPKHVRAILSVVVPTLVADLIIALGLLASFFGSQLAFIVVLLLMLLAPFVMGSLVCEFSGVRDGRLGCAMAAGLLGGPLCGSFLISLFGVKWLVLSLPVLIPLVMVECYNRSGGKVAGKRFWIVWTVSIALLVAPIGFVPMVALYGRRVEVFVGIGAASSYVFAFVVIGRLLLWADGTIGHTRLDTPLHEVVRSGKEEEVAKLLADGVDVDVPGESGKTPLHEAVAAGFVDIAQLLLDSGAEVNATDHWDMTPLHYVAEVRDKAYAELMTELLISKGSEVKAGDHFGSTALHNAAYYNQPEVAEVLLVNGANPRVRNTTEKTALDIAEERGHEEVAEVIRRHGKEKSGGPMAHTT